MAEMGRPIKPLDWDRVKELAKCGCKGTEIASYFNMHVQTLYDKVRAEYNLTFTDFMGYYHEKGKAELREAQFNKAVIEKDNTMLIWLGKHILDQKEFLKVDANVIHNPIKTLIGEIIDKSPDLVEEKIDLVEGELDLIEEQSPES